MTISPIQKRVLARLSGTAIGVEIVIASISWYISEMDINEYVGQEETLFVVGWLCVAAALAWKRRWWVALLIVIGVIGCAVAAGFGVLIYSFNHNKLVW